MGFLAPTVKVNQEVGRASEFAVTRSNYGDPIPRAAGTDRFDGQLIWGREIRQVKTTDTQTEGGKGGQKTETTTTTYEYFVNFAISFATGIGDRTATSLLRIWADGKVIYDNLTPSTLVNTESIELFFGIEFETVTESVQAATVDWLDFRFYPGTETQLPDPLIESFEGEDNTPAYRGQAYVVFEDFKISDFGNRIPVITAQIAFTDAQIAEAQVDYFPALVGSNGLSSADRYAYDYGSKNMIVGADTVNVGKEDFLFSTTSLSKLGEYNQPGTSDVAGILDDGQTALFQEVTDSSIGDDYNIVQLGGNVTVDRDVNNKPTRMSTIQNIGQNVLFGEAGGVLVGDDRGLIFLNVSTNVDTYINPNANQFFAVGNVAGINGDAWASLYNGDGTRDEIRLYRATSAGATQYDTITPDFVLAGQTQFNSVSRTWHFDKVNNALIFGVNLSGTLYVVSYDITTRSRNWISQVPHLWGTYRNRTGGADLDVGNFLIWSGGTGSRFPVAVNLKTGALDATFDGTTDVGINIDDNGMYIESQNAIWSGNGNQGQGMYRYVLAVDFAQQLEARQIITELMRDAGYDDSEFDVSQIPAVVVGVASFVLRDRQKFSQSLENLLTLIGAEVAPVDGIVKFFPLGQATSRTIPVSDLIRTNERQLEPFVIGTRRERDLPKSFEVSYAGVENDYQPAVQRASRVANPVSISLTEQPEDFEFSGAGRADFMQSVAQRELFRLWAEIERYGYRMPQRYLDVAPGDTVTLDLENGTGVLGRLSTADVGANFSIDVDQVVEVDGQYVTTGVGNAGDGAFQRTIPTLEDSVYFLLNLPLLRDTDTVGQELSVFYLVANGISNWPGMLLYREEGSVLDQLGQQVNGFAGGVTGTVVPDPTTTTRFDEQSFDIITTFGTDRFSTTTIANVLAGANTLAVIKANGETEVIQFRRAELQSDGVTITVSDLLRGRRGTELYATGHGAQETVVLLETNTAEPVTVPLGQVNSVQNFVGPTIGQLVESAVEKQFTPTAEDLKPYAPVQLQAIDDGMSGIDLSWVRRTRIGGELSDGSDVPLSEASEQYEVDILDAPGGNVLRTLTTTTQSVNYPAADVTTDFGSVPATLDVVVYQISGAIGRGKPATETLEVL